jgi:peptide deformylase
MTTVSNSGRHCQAASSIRRSAAAACRRAAYAVAEGVDLQGQPVVVADTGELARCLQHETDHLLGKLYIDRLAGPERQRIMRQVY